MKKSKLETAETRQRIIDVAAREFRANGIQATGLADLMAAAGLSHGGFYRHFESKDELVAQACEASLASLVGALEAAADQHEGKDGFKAIVDAYVSVAHRDRCADGCPIAGLGSELARADAQTRAAVSEGLSRMIDVMAKRIGRRDKARARSEAAFALAAMIGAVTVSRIIGNPEQSAALLDDVRHRLEAM